MKKLISLLTVIVLVAVLATAALATEAPALVVDTVESAAGEQVVVNVAIVNNPGITVGEMYIEYDETALEPVDLVPDDPEDEDTFGVQYVTAVADWKWEIIFNDANGFLGMSASKGTLKGDCVMFSLTFKVKDGAQPGSYPVKVDVDYIGDDDADLIYGETFEGAVVVACTNHVAGEVQIENVVPATCQAPGSHDEVTYCSICGFEMSRVNVPDALLAHTPADAVVENEVPASCQAPGSYDKVVYCSECGTELSRETVPVEQLAHTPADAVVENETPATCQVPGSYEEVVYCSECGEELSRTKFDTELGDHVAGEAVKENISNADCQTKGSYDLVVYCTVCGAELSREHVDGELGDHVAGDVVIENEVVGADCQTAGSYDEVVYCTLCGEELSRETKEGQYGEHSWDTVVTPASCCNDGLEVVSCKVCGEVSSETVLPATGEHTIVYYDNEDGLTHTVYCQTGDKVLDDAEAHTYGEFVEDTENPGWKYKVCDRCGYEHRESIPAFGDNSMISVAVATLAMLGIAVVVSKKKEF